jgi:hypothetical protein
MSSQLCGTCGAPFLAAASEKVALVVPGIGDISHYSRGQRIGIAGVLVAVVLVPLALITFLLTPEPKQDSKSTPVTVTTVAPPS